MKNFKHIFSSLALVGALSSAVFGADFTQKTLKVGEVQIYEKAGLKLHAYNTKDALSDEAYIIETSKALIAIEMPSFTKNLDEWQDYTKALKKPLKAVLVANHATGKDYVKGVKIYATKDAKKAIESGSVKAITDGLVKSFGADFQGGDKMLEVNQNLEFGKNLIEGVEFDIVADNDVFDIKIPALNAVYTHMLGQKVHSILVSKEQINALISKLEAYQKAGFELILSAHHTPEGQEALSEKIAYLKKAKELIAKSKNAETFISLMKKEFKDYAGENYLQMSAGALFK
ncbi:hypothetical protein DMB92_00425 [Campylobacter sp. MIT 99-7217]|uniref:hypothetical protein n=1 Tax=Campylobacter sp. MIT 99-7217 TaxID=535091 RepID=UPI001157929B|nr:hypothetical protein [Campylobacter sp. MIT 99-7217]TQR34464.1 hypothetical protein DMB92_00425 [Campylobacter sp. MIT 99-7217]